MADQTRLEQLPTIDGTLLREWPRPPGAHPSWDRWSLAERQQWLLDRTYERVDGGWVVSDDPRHRQVRDQVLRAVDAVPTVAGIEFLTDMITDEIDGGMDADDADDPGCDERDQRRSLLRYVILVALLILVVAAALVWIFGDRGSPDPEEIATPSGPAPVTTVDEIGADDAERADLDPAENGIAPIGGVPVGNEPIEESAGRDGPVDGDAGLATSTTMPGHEDYLGIFSDGETGVRLGADGTYTLVMSGAGDEGRFRLTLDDDGQVRLQFLEPDDDMTFRIAMPVALHPGGLWWGTAESGRLLPRATSLPEFVIPSDHVVLHGDSVDEISFLWRTMYPNLELDPRAGAGRAVALEPDSVSGTLELDLETGTVDGELTIWFRSPPDNRHGSVHGDAVLRFETGTVGASGRGDWIAGTASADLTFIGELSCADEMCDGSYRATVPGDYRVIAARDGHVQLEFAWTGAHEEFVVGSQLDPGAVTSFGGMLTGQSARD